MYRAATGFVQVVVSTNDAADRATFGIAMVLHPTVNARLFTQLLDQSPNESRSGGNKPCVGVEFFVAQAQVG